MQLVTRTCLIVSPICQGSPWRSLPSLAFCNLVLLRFYFGRRHEVNGWYLAFLQHSWISGHWKPKRHGTWVFEVTEFKSEAGSDLRGCLEASMASEASKIAVGNMFMFTNVSGFKSEVKGPLRLFGGFEATRIWTSEFSIALVDRSL